MEFWQAMVTLDLPVEGPISTEVIDAAFRQRTLEHNPDRLGPETYHGEKHRRRQQMDAFLTAARAKVLGYLQYQEKHQIQGSNVAPGRQNAQPQRDARPAPYVSVWPVPKNITPNTIPSEPLAESLPSLRIITVSRYMEAPRVTWKQVHLAPTSDPSTNYAGYGIFSPAG